jgi:predicted PurR-regulated permease PerM
VADTDNWLSSATSVSISSRRGRQRFFASELGLDVTIDQNGSVDGDQFATTLIELAIRVAVLALLIYLSLVLLHPFITIVIWSAVLAVALYPAFEWLSQKLGSRRRLAATLITVLSLLVVIGPATWLALGLIDSFRSLAGRLDLSLIAIPAPPLSIKNLPVVGDQIYQWWSLASTNLQSTLAEFAPQLKPLGGTLLRIAANAGTGMLQFLISIVVAGFLLSPAPAIVQRLKLFSKKLTSSRAEEFVDLTGATIRAVSKGVIGISALQAVLVGLGLIVAGVPGASLITSAVLILGIVQIGPALVIFPVVIWAWFNMETGSAFLFTIYMLPVNLLDNILKPIVMARGLNTPMLVILLGIVGGTLSYGISGLFLGPIVLAVIWELFAAWIREDTLA